MPVVFRGGAQDAPRYPIVRTQKSSFVQFLAEPLAIKSTYLHWLIQARRCVPCLGEEECPWCPGPTRWEAYAPVLWQRLQPVAWDANGAVVKHGPVWVPAILRITESMADILEQSHIGEVIEIERVNEKRQNSPLRWSVKQRLPAAAVSGVAPFDVVPTLMRVWGMYAVMKRRTKDEDLVEKEKQLEEFAAEEGGVE